MSWSRDREYVPVASRRVRGAKQMKALEKKGRKIEPLGQLTHRIKIATSFWGHGWCQHLESFSDYENRLPRGRTYVRNGSVLHLHVEAGKVESVVQGSELYEISIRIDPLAPARWQTIQSRCRGRIGSLIELLQGKLSSEIMTIVTDKTDGLFPSPQEIHLKCDCPDWATMCKHVAAVLYGIGARLDTAPELLFTLRGVDQSDLIATGDDAIALPGAKRKGRRTLAADSLNDIFGVELHGGGPPPAAAPPTAAFDPTPAGIRELRERRGLSRVEFAREVGVSAASIANWEEATGPLKLAAKSVKRLRACHGVF